jgi:glycosyltransferase 2 family protein
VGAFFHAVRVFGDRLVDVHWELLAIALGLHFGKLVLRAIAWRAILRASYPEARPRFRSVFGAYAAGVGVNSIAPARTGDLVKLYLVRHRVEGSHYPTLVPTLAAETVLDFFVAGGLMIWALSIGVLPTHQVYSRIPTVDWKFLFRYQYATAITLAVLVTATVIGLAVFAEYGGEFRARVRLGFAVFGDPPALVRGVLLPQALSWVLRIATVYFFLRAFDVPASLHNALLVQVVDSLATLFPATPGGAGTKQGLVVFVFRGQAVSSSLLLAFSVGMNIALVVFNVLLGAVAIALMTRSLSWRKLRHHAGRQASPGPD